MTDFEFCKYQGWDSTPRQHIATQCYLSHNSPITIIQSYIITNQQIGLWSYIQNKWKIFLFFIIPWQCTYQEYLETKAKKDLQDFWDKVRAYFSHENIFTIFLFKHTHTKTTQKRPASLKAEKKEVLAQSCMFTLFVLPLNKTELSITALEI